MGTFGLLYVLDRSRGNCREGIITWALFLALPWGGGKVVCVWVRKYGFLITRFDISVHYTRLKAVTPSDTIIPDEIFILDALWSVVEYTLEYTVYSADCKLNNLKYWLTCMSNKRSQCFHFKQKLLGSNKSSCIFHCFVNVTQCFCNDFLLLLRHTFICIRVILSCELVNLHVASVQVKCDLFRSAASD